MNTSHHYSAGRRYIVKHFAKIKKESKKAPLDSYKLFGGAFFALRGHIPAILTGIRREIKVDIKINQYDQVK